MNKNNKENKEKEKIEKFEKYYDVFKTFLVKEADYSGFLELPKIKTSEKLPERVISFSKAMNKNCRDFDSWVMFYEHDVMSERLWRNPRAYLKKLKKFKGVISPDYSLYRNMPLVMQMWNTYRSRAIGFWLCKNGVEIIPNARFGDERTYDFCFEGIERNKTVAVGSHGCIKNKTDREYFKLGLSELVKRLEPKNLIVYGVAPDSIFKKYRDMGINIIPFESEISKARKQVRA